MKNIEIPNTDAGCSDVVDKNASGGTGGHVRRILWRRNGIVVYQDALGHFWQADLDQKRQRRALILGGLHDAA